MQFKIALLLTMIGHILFYLEIKHTPLLKPDTPLPNPYYPATDFIIL